MRSFKLYRVCGSLFIYLYDVTYNCNNSHFCRFIFVTTSCSFQNLDAIFQNSRHKTQNGYHLQHRLSNVQNIALCIHIFKEILHLHNHWFKRQIYCEIPLKHNYRSPTHKTLIWNEMCELPFEMVVLWCSVVSYWTGDLCWMNK